MVVVSLFDGMSCGNIALNRLGINVSAYYASEIDKYAIRVTQHNFPNTIQLGDVTKVKAKDLAKVPDLLIGGSPCQGFSFAGKQLNFNDSRSVLFFEYVRILKEIRELNPNVLFLLENVNMKKEYQDIISEHLGVEPIKINSALVSAQNRVRLYWTNIPIVSLPEDKGILLKDILEDGEVDRDKSLCLDANYHKGASPERYFTKSKRQIVLLDSHSSKNGLKCVGALASKKWRDDGKNLQRNFSQGERVYSTEGKAPTLSANGGGTAGSSCIIKVENVNPSGMSGNVYSTEGKSPTLTTNKGEGIKITNTPIQVGTADDVNGHDILKRIYSKEGKAPTLNTMGGGNREPKVAISERTWRKLTPLECERLQTVPDNYSRIVSNSQRYKMLGNGWTIDVICHLLKNIDLY